MNYREISQAVNAFIYRPAAPGRSTRKGAGRIRACLRLTAIGFVFLMTSCATAPVSPTIEVAGGFSAAGRRVGRARTRFVARRALFLGGLRSGRWLAPRLLGVERPLDGTVGGDEDDVVLDRTYHQAIARERGDVAHPVADLDGVGESDLATGAGVGMGVGEIRGA